VGDLSGTPDGENELGRHLAHPACEQLGALRAIVRAADLEGAELGGGKSKLRLMRKIRGVKGTTPRFVSPTRDADTDGPRGTLALDVEVRFPLPAAAVSIETIAG
jgi:hypothetical protein